MSNGVSHLLLLRTAMRQAVCCITEGHVHVADIQGALLIMYVQADSMTTLHCTGDLTCKPVTAA